MRWGPPIAFAAVVVSAMLALLGGPQSWGGSGENNGPIATPVEGTSSAAGQGGVGATATADPVTELWNEALGRIERAQAITAQTRCYGRLFNVSVLLEGQYWQLNRGGKTQVRYEVLSKIPGKSDRPPTKTLQLSDGRFLWEIAEQGGERRVARTDLQQLQHQAWQDKLNIVRLGGGGLPKLIAALRRDFVWTTPVADELDGLSVWKLKGRWSEARQSQLVPGYGGDPEKWPPYLPDEVEVLLGQDDLFLYRLDYRRQDKSLLLCEFYEVAMPAYIDERMFHWQNPEPQIEDRTDQMRRRLEAASGSATR